MTKRPLHCAGPFSVAAASTLDACTRPGPLGIAGEMDVLAYARKIDGQITLTPPGGRTARITLDGARTAVTEIFAAPAARPGARTPATLFGADLITRLPGSGPSPSPTLT